LPTYYASLDQCQQAEERDEKGTKSSPSICVQLNNTSRILTHKCHLPPIKEIEKTITEEHLFKQTQQNMNQIQERAQVAMRETIEAMEEHLIQPANV
jgi:hypothetical protein